MATMWMASPPEVHSTLLSAGSGAGSLLSAATAWSSLSAEYADVADELMALLVAVQAGVWEGPSVEQYVAAHIPYLAWLTRAGTTAARAAAQHEIVAAAYEAALAAMPTLPELAANHVIHGTLVATNFFVMNTIPIALNEADYVRMWIQAASTMATYQTVSDAALASTSPTGTAPEIVQETQSSAGTGVETHAGEPTVIDYVVADFLRNISGGRVDWNVTEGTLNGLPFEDYTNAADPYWWVARAIEFPKDFETFIQELLTNPQEAFQSYSYLIFVDYPEHIPQLFQALIQSPQLLAFAFGAAASNVGAAIGLAGLSGLAAVQPPAVPAVVALPGSPPASVSPAVGMAPVASVAPTAPAPAPTPAPATSSIASAGPTPPPASAITGPGFPFLVGGGPGIGHGSGMRTSASAAAKKKAPEPDVAAAAAGAAARSRTRRRRRAGLHDHNDEFMNMNVDVEPDWGAPAGGESTPSAVFSEQGAGTLGFAGTASREAAIAAGGMARLEEDEFGSGPKLPMIPGTWRGDEAGAS